MNPVLSTANEQTQIIFTTLALVLVVLSISIARFIDHTGYRLPNLAAYNPLPKILLKIFLIGAWLYVTYYAIGLVATLGFMALFAGSGELLFYAFLYVLLYILLVILTFFWYRGGFISNAIMTILITVPTSYIFFYKPAWVCKPVAESGYSFAYMCLARAYEAPGNQGVYPDAKKMHYWYKQAALAGYTEAAYLMGLNSRDLSLRESFLKQAAEDGHLDAAHRYATIVKDKKLAHHWLTYAADRGQADALFDLAQRYESGIGVAKDLKKARELWIKSAEGGSVRGMMTLASRYAFGYAPFERNAELSEKWEKLARARDIEIDNSWSADRSRMHVPSYDRRKLRRLERKNNMMSVVRENSFKEDVGDEESLKILAENYLSHPSKDPILRRKALEIYRKLASGSNFEIQYTLAKLLLADSAPEDEQTEGRRWLIVAAEGNQEHALRDTIDAFEYGKHGFPVDLYEAKRFSDRLVRFMETQNNNRIVHDRKMYVYTRNHDLARKIKHEEREKEIAQLKSQTQESKTSTEPQTITPSKVQAKPQDVEALFLLAHKLMIQGKRKESLQLRKEAAEMGHADAQYLEARSIMFSSLQIKQSELAFSYYLSAARQNHPAALATLGDVYRNGNRYIQLKKNLYLAKVYYQKALAFAKGDLIYKHNFGNPSTTTSITASIVQKNLDALPAAIKRLDLEGLSAEKRKAGIKEWYYREIEEIAPGADSAERLKFLNQQREALLSDLQKS